MDRKSRSKAKRPNSVTIKPLQPDQDSRALDSVPQDFFTAPVAKTYNSAQPNETKSSSSEESPTITPYTQDSENRGDPTEPVFAQKDHYATAPAQDLPESAAINLPMSTPLTEKKKLPSKKWAMTTVQASRTFTNRSNVQEIPLDSLLGPIQLQDSLHESLTFDQASMFHYLKSQGQFRLPSISSSITHTKKFSSNLDSPLSHRIVSGRKYKLSSGNSARSAIGTDQEKSQEMILGDSLEPESDSLIVLKNQQKGHKRQFRISSVGTVRSKYLSSCEDVSCFNKISLKESEHIPSLVMRDMNKQEGIGKPEEHLDTRSDLTSSQHESVMSESLNERCSVNTSSEKTMITVISQDDGSRLGLSRTMSHGLKITDMTETEYCGEVKRLCLLGSGSEAKVFLCKVKDYEDEVALKQYDLVKNQRRNGEAYGSLYKEFEMLKSLDHENIIKYICLYKPHQTTYNNCLEFGIIMEYMPGGSLETYIEENFNLLSFVEKKNIMRQMLSGLDFLHLNNIIHRDLKPGNILLSADKKTVKISDFGISKKTNSDSVMKRTFVGTPWYMAPEVISQEGYSSKADIWSAGCCLFHLITGQKPYHNANAIQALLLMVNHKSPLEACSPELLARINEHAGVKEFLELCFNRNKNERPHAGELLQHKMFEGA